MSTSFLTVYALADNCKIYLSIHKPYVKKMHTRRSSKAIFDIYRVIRIST